MSKWLFVFVVLFNVQHIVAQCVAPEDVLFADFTTCTTCNGAPNLNHIRVYDNFCLEIDFLNDINSELTFGDIVVNIYENNILIHSKTVEYPYGNGSYSSVYYNHKVETPGVYTYKAEINFEYAGCTDFFHEKTIEIYGRECPFIELEIMDSSPCLFPESSRELKLQISDNSATILNTFWEISGCGQLNTEAENHNSVGTYVTQGNTFLFDAPHPGSFCASAVSQVQLSNGTICMVDVNGANCLLPISTDLYSDPFFEVQGILQSGNDIDVVFKGTQIYPLNNNHRYYLYHNSTLIATVDNLQFDQVIATLNSISPGNHVLKLVGEADKVCMDEYSYEIRVADEQAEVACESCNTFRPQPGERYWVSAWVKENQAAQVKTYTNPRLEFGFTGSGVAAVPFYPSGDIVEGWQRIVGSFTIPANTTALDIKLVNGHASMEAYFDDIRIHPYNASMKSYVYDPATYLLSAELDDNNYATFYEYDKEGQLIRIKKETARGIMTIQESRSSNPKR